MTHEEYIQTCKNSGMSINYHEEEGYCEIFFDNIKTKSQQRAVINKLNIFLKEYRNKKK